MAWSPSKLVWPGRAWRLFKRGVMAWSWTAALVLGACSGNETGFDAAFATPVGLAVAGTETVRLFVSNQSEDSLQMLRMGTTLSSLEFEQSPAQYFPLRILVGTAPTDLGATADRRYVVALNPAVEALTLVDADTLTPALNGGEVMQFALGQAGSAPSAMVMETTPCDAPCSGRGYAALGGTGRVQAFEVLDLEGGQILFTQDYDVGGRPLGLAVDPQNRWLFVTDGQAPELIRVDLMTGEVGRRTIGEVGGPVAVSSDGTTVVVGRPEARDVVVLTGADEPGFDSFSVIDANTLFGPSPQCVVGCGSAEECVNVHPADLALCADDGGLSAVGDPYPAVFLGDVPVKIAALGAGRDDPALSVPCAYAGEGDDSFDLDDDDDATRETFAEFVAIAFLDGTVQFVGLKAGSADAVAPRVADLGWCDPPLLTSETASTRTPEVVLADFVDGCPSLPDRQRFVCAEEDSGSGVGLLPGLSGTVTARLTWEGLVDADLDRDEGGGLITEDGRFTDIGLDLAEYPIRPRTSDHQGDILEILSDPLEGEECDPGGDISAFCENSSGGCCLFERRITAIESVGGQAQLELDRPLPTGCFRDNGAIAYRIRSGDQFVLSGPASARLSPGESFGPGLDVGQGGRLLFRLKDGDSRPGVEACERYGPNGDNPPASIFLRTEDEPLSFRVQERHIRVVAGIVSDAASGTSAPIGRIPGAMIVAKLSEFGEGDGTVILLSYSGSDRIAGFVPFDANPDALSDSLTRRD